MLGWFNAARTWASREKRASRSGSVVRDVGRTLMATSRPSFVSRARHTCPMPPSPRTDTISYDPTREPGPTGISYQKDGAIVTDLTERFADPDAVQSAAWNTACAPRRNLVRGAQSQKQVYSFGLRIDPHELARNFEGCSQLA